MKIGRQYRLLGNQPGNRHRRFKRRDDIRCRVTDPRTKRSLGRCILITMVMMGLNLVGMRNHAAAPQHNKDCVNQGGAAGNGEAGGTLTEAFHGNCNLSANPSERYPKRPYVVQQKIQPLLSYINRHDLSTYSCYILPPTLPSPVAPFGMRLDVCSSDDAVQHLAQTEGCEVRVSALC